MGGGVHTEPIRSWLLTPPTAVLDFIVRVNQEPAMFSLWQDRSGMCTRTSPGAQRGLCSTLNTGPLVSHSEVQTGWSDFPSANTFLTTVCFLVSKCHRKGLSASSVIQWPEKIIRCHFVSGQLVCA